MNFHEEGVDFGFHGSKGTIRENRSVRQITEGVTQIAKRSTVFRNCMAATQVFISYASEDRESAVRLAEFLNAAGYPTFMDVHIGKGKRFDREIERALADASCVVLLWTKNSVDSDWVRAEADVAAARGTLLPVMLEQVEVPLFFRTFQAFDLTAWKGKIDDARLNGLANEVGAKAGTAPAQTAAPVPSASPRKGGKDRKTPARPAAKKPRTRARETPPKCEVEDLSTGPTTRLFVIKLKDGATLRLKVKFKIWEVDLSLSGTFNRFKISDKRSLAFSRCAFDPLGSFIRFFSGAQRETNRDDPVWRVVFAIPPIPAMSHTLVAEGAVHPTERIPDQTLTLTFDGEIIYPAP